MPKRISLRAPLAALVLAGCGESDEPTTAEQPAASETPALSRAMPFSPRIPANARARFGGWRLWAVTSLVMYGVKTLYPEQACRLAG